MRYETKAVIAMLAWSAGAAAAQTTLTLYGGARGGGEFESANDNGRTTYTLASGGVAAASVDWMFADGTQGQVFYSFQRSALPGAAFGRPVEVDVDIGTLHIGGRSFFEGSARQGGGYVVGGLGATFFSPGLSGLSDEVRPSLNVGVGYQWPVAANIALRTELRSTISLINSSSGFLCSGGCVVSIRGTSLVQVEALLGLSIGF